MGLAVAAYTRITIREQSPAAPKHTRYAHGRDFRHGLLLPGVTMNLPLFHGSAAPWLLAGLLAV
jgi:hypothetical protein